MSFSLMSSIFIYFTVVELVFNNLVSIQKKATDIVPVLKGTSIFLLGKRGLVNGKSTLKIEHASVISNNVFFSFLVERDEQLLKSSNRETSG